MISTPGVLLFALSKKRLVTINYSSSIKRPNMKRTTHKRQTHTHTHTQANEETKTSVTGDQDGRADGQTNINRWIVSYIFTPVASSTLMRFPSFKTGRGETQTHLYRQINQSQTSAKHRGIIDVWFLNVKCLVMNLSSNTTDITPLDRESSRTHCSVAHVHSLLAASVDMLSRAESRQMLSSSSRHSITSRDFKAISCKYKADH